MFLRKKDFKPQVRTEILSIISSFDDGNVLDAEAKCISRMTGYLFARFDTAAIFAPLVHWNASSIFAQGTRIILTADGYNATLTYIANNLAVYNGKVYKANQTATGTWNAVKWDMLGDEESLYLVSATNTTAGSLPTSGDYTAGDNRTPVIVETLIDMMLYLLHSSIGRNQMPIMRDERHKQAIDWLKDIRDGLLQDPALTSRLAADGTVDGSLLRYGSETSFNSAW